MGNKKRFNQKPTDLCRKAFECFRKSFEKSYEAICRISEKQGEAGYSVDNDDVLANLEAESSKLFGMGQRYLMRYESKEAVSNEFIN